MKSVFKPGEKREYRKRIGPDDIATFHDENVHPVYATFSLARDAEWTSRQFVLEMKDGDEEGIGTFLSVEHKGPAFVGEEVVFTAWVDHFEANELVCFYEARVGERLIAIGRTGQKILKKEKISRIFQTPAT
ncbi:MAG TPA: hypothetical protein VKZ68_10190 [Ohtaekwangia sp.]|nr:hypothetical protein [Ohtaekwangia sp.]